MACNNTGVLSVPCSSINYSEKYLGSTAEVVAVLYRGAFREREMVVLLCGLSREAIGKRDRGWGKGGD